MRAKYGSECGECGRHIWPDDEIEPLEYGFGWVHAKCPTPPKAKVCPSCWMEIALSGEHDCEADR